MLKSGHYTIEIRCVRVDSKIMYETTWPVINLFSLDTIFKDMGEMYIN